MPEPKSGEKKEDFIARCIPFMLKEKEGMEQDQAIAICYSIWRENEKSEAVVKKIDKYLNESITDVENFVRNNLSGTSRRTSADLMWNSVKKKFKNMEREDFDEVWEGLIDDGYLEKVNKDTYKWSE